jgi:FlaA1/EpsC-like NDP-sugar epimerase
MLSRQHNFYQQFLQLIDAALICFSLWVGHALRFYLLNQVDWLADYPAPPQFSNCYWMIALALPLGPLALEYVGIYQTRTFSEFPREIGRIMLAMLLVLVAIFTCITVLRIPQVNISRAALVIFFLLAVTLLALRSFFFLLWLRQRGARVHLRQYILLCGRGEDRQTWKDRFMAQPGKNFEIRAEFDLSQEGLKRFIDKLHDEMIDIVVFSLHETILPQVREALLACEAEGVEAWISADFIQTLFTHVQFDQFAGQPLLIYRTAPTTSMTRLATRP